MADAPKNQGPNTAAKRGKVKGAGDVQPKEKAAKVAPVEKPGEGEEEYEAAFRAGLEASQRGSPSRPPLGYSLLEVKGWYAGYKSHANPNNEGRVEDIEGGYRGNY